MKLARFSKDQVGTRTMAGPGPAQLSQNPEPDSQSMLMLEPSPEKAEQLRLQSALIELKAATEANPDSAADWYRYGDALLGLKRPAEAVPVLRKAVSLSPDTDLLRYDLGLALLDLDQPVEAGAQFVDIVERDPQLNFAGSNLMLAAMMNLALCQEQTGQRDAAVDTLLPALETAVGILFNLGFLHFRAKRFEAALSFAQAAYVLRPSNEDIVHQYGAVLSELDRPIEAVKILKEATTLNPQCAGAWYDLGLAQARLGRRRLARSCFHRSLEIDPGRAWSYYDLACLDALEGRKARAFENLRQAVARGFRNLDHLRRDADLKSLRRDPRWGNLIRQLGELAHSNN